MSLYRLDNIFKPKSVAVIGASDRPKTVGRALVNNLIDGGFEGAIYPVNMKKKEILGSGRLPQAERHREARGPGRDQHAHCHPFRTSWKNAPGWALAARSSYRPGARRSALKVKPSKPALPTWPTPARCAWWVPTAWGVISMESKLNASFGPTMPLPGNLAFISQSGAICTAVLDYALKEKVGFSYFISIGSMLDVDYGDLIDYLGNAPNVSSILLYIEMVNNHRKFMSAARAVSRVKPIVVLKSGRSAAGAKAAPVPHRIPGR